jgi:Ca-activated chloride channel family protein
MTDMMPNTGSTGQNSISRTVEGAADRGIYTTFVGMGIDANPDLTESLSKIRGANHYFVHSAEEFKRRLDEEFEFMITPLVFDLQLELDGSAAIEAVYGSPTADRSTGQLMHVPTLFPSPTEDGETRGGVVLLKLDGKPTADLELVASWEKIDGTLEDDRVTVEFSGDEGEQFENDGIQKAICLARYGRTLREWISEIESGPGGDDWQPMRKSNSSSRREWERGSQEYFVPERYRERFEALATYIAETAEAVDDDTLDQEVELLDTLIEHEGSSGPDLDLSETAQQRLRDLIELVPTKNSELAEAWEMESGSEVHAYLERELAEFYERGDASRIHLSDRGEEVLEKLHQ